MKRYSPKDIEGKWQKYWDQNGTYVANLASDKPKYIAMSMFNYPSGAGIHIGHAMNYTISDVLARLKRQQGFESYHPVGWDAFGLPAENYAIKAGVSPQESMATIIPNYHKQYKAMGWSNDWSKEIATHEPIYYKWTQWIFSEMHRAGLAYQDSRMQWWCSKCQTVLANEQIIDGKCWRHDSPDDPIVEQKEVKQWFFKITEYADELLEAIDGLDWTEVVKTAQRNWIGRKSGIEITYQIENANIDADVVCFTTRPDTNFGATFVVIAPEHELAAKVADGSLRAAEGSDVSAQVRSYIQSSLRKSEVERQQEGRQKTGVFTGLYAINSLNGKKLPIWVSDFVLAGFGTGAVVGVPGHDTRDFEFADKFHLPVIRVVATENGDESPITKLDQVQEQSGTMVNSEFLNGLDIHEATQKMMDHMEQTGMGKRITNYRMRDWSVSRQRYWGAPIPIVHCPDHGAVLLPDSELPVILPELTDFVPSGDGRSALARATDWLKAPCPTCGKEGERETDTLDTYICSSWYMIRYFDPHNEHEAFDSTIANKWMPIDFYNGADHATAHMLYARFVTRFFHKKGLLKNPEPFKKFLFNGKVTAHDGQMFSKSKGNGVDPLEIIDQGYGADALRTYLMFASPLDLWTRWDPNGVPATYRFLSRIWNLVQEFLEKNSTEEKSEQVLIKRSIHTTIKKVTEDLEATKYNTAIAAMMKCVNELYIFKENPDSDFKYRADWQFALECLVQLVAPFAPHAAEELWHDLGHDDSVQVDHWPIVEEKYLVKDSMRLAVQVNGKVRAEIEVAVDEPEEEIKKLALAQDNVVHHLGTAQPKKVIYVSGRLVSIVV